MRYLQFLLVAVLLTFAAVPASFSATSANANSPVGTNVGPVNYYSANLAFLDLFKTNNGWSTLDKSGSETHEEQYLNLDSNGWPINLKAVGNSGAQRFTQVAVLILRNLPNTSNGNYPAGQYIVRYQGEGTLNYNFDAVKVPSLSSPGRDVINVTPSWGGGVFILITNTDPNHTGNYIRNIQVVKAENESALLAGKVFNPAYLSALQNFRTLRFMDWFQINGSTETSWANRSVTSAMSWVSKPRGGSQAVPYEVAIQLANSVSADAWINVPAMADENYIQQLAALTHAQLGPSQKAYVEYSNEVWNMGFPQYAYATQQGKLLWPSAGANADFQNNFFGMKSAQICDTWKASWGSDSGRVVCVMAAQAANHWIASERLNCSLWSGAPCAKHGIDAIAIAPYFGGQIPAAWASQSDGGLNTLFASLTSQNDPSVPAGGWIGQALGWAASYKQVTSQFNLPLISYEGGQTFYNFTSTAARALGVAANRDIRMEAAYQTYLQGLKANGEQLFMNYTDIFANATGGTFGALESIMQTRSPITSAPPKWQALENFISNNPCWWANCTGAIGSGGVTPPPAVPNPPANLRVN